MGILISELAVPEWETYNNPNPTEAELGMWQEGGFYLAKETANLLSYTQVELFSRKFNRDKRKEKYPSSLHLHYAEHHFTRMVFNMDKQTMCTSIELSCNEWLYIVDRMRELKWKEEKEYKNLDEALNNMGLKLELAQPYIVAFSAYPRFVHFSPSRTQIYIQGEYTLTELLVILHK